MCRLLNLDQSAEYDKRVTNISLFIYIGSPGLYQNSRQAPGSSCQLPSRTHARTRACTHTPFEVASGVPGSVGQIAAMNVKYHLLFEDLQKFTFTTSLHCYSIE